jgi:cysteine synthase B
MLNQFANEDNWKRITKTTGPEIWNDTDGTVTTLCCCNGNYRNNNGNFYLFERKNPSIQIVGAQPTDGSQIPGIRKWPQEYLPKDFDASKVIEVMRAEARYDQTTALEEGICRSSGIQ